MVPQVSNWLRVLGIAERSQVDQRIRQQLHPIVPLLDTFKTSQQPLEFVLPRKGPLDSHASRLASGVEESLAPALGALAVAGIRWDGGEQARIENALPIVRSIKAAIEREIGTSEVHPELFGHLLQRLQALRQQHHVRLMDGRHGDGS
jgi:hypothetical protein